MRDVELGQRRSTPSPPREPSLTAPNLAEPGVRALQSREVDFTDDQKRRLLETLFPKLSVDEEILEKWNEHLQKLNQMIRGFHDPLLLESRLDPNSIEGAVDAITSAINLMRSHSTEPWSLMAERLRPLQGTSGLEVKCLVASVVYFWLRVKMELWEIADPRKWSDERSLVENVASRFPSPGTTSEARRDLAMSDDFTGANISRFSGVRIKMTDSVDRHLELDINSSSRSSHYLSILFYVFISRRIRRTQTTLKVFCDMEGFLMLFTQKLEDGSPVCPLPPTLYYEVYNSLGLLFPKRKHFKTYFGKTVARKIPFYFFVIGGERNLSCYEVFNARLGELLNLYSNPTIHWWHPLIDRRNKREHFTLWIAIWAFLLGFFSLVTGLVSGIYAVKQYDLGLAAACAESGDHPRMKPYCG